MHDEVALGLDEYETRRPINRESPRNSGDGARPSAGGRSILADLIEELTPELARQSAKEGAEAGTRLSWLLAALASDLRNGRVEVASCKQIYDITTDAAPIVNMIQTVRDSIYDAIEERALSVSTREMRLLAQWFADTSQALLRAESSRLGSILDSLEDHIVLKNRKSQIIYANRAARAAVRARNVADEAVIGGKARELGVSESVSRVVEAIATRAFTGETVTSEMRFPSDRGSWRENRVGPVYGGDGSVEAVVVASRDIHARKMAEARLELLSRVGAITETMDYDRVLNAIARLAIPELADWCIIDVVEDGKRRRGAAAHRDPAKAALIEELLATAPPLLDTPQGREVLAGRAVIVRPAEEGCGRNLLADAKEIVRQLGAGSMLIAPLVVLGSTVAIAKFVLTPDSERIHGPDDLALVEELARRAGQLIENARLHQELEASERRFRIALEHARVAIFEEDTESRLRWMYNPQLGAVGDALIGTNKADRLAPEEAAKLEGLKRELLATGEGFRVELETVRGGQRHVIVHYEPLKEADGKIVGFVGAGLDVTDEKKAQRDLADALAFRERMMGVLGHDLRNPLSAICSISAMLLQRELPERVREGLHRVDLSARRMAEMIETLLDFTQTRFQGALPVDRQPMDLARVTREVVDELRASHSGREIRLVTPEMLQGEWDPARVAQVVSNLVANALTHGASDASVEVSLSEGDGEAVLLVRNQGTPIPGDLVTRIFEPLHRGKTNGHSERSLGLGLYIVREIVKAHGGSIGVDSSSEATVFTVRLGR